MPANPYDQACRYLLKLAPIALLAWLLRRAPTDVHFVEWLDARQVPWPGQPDRICDTIAHLRDPTCDGVPWALVVEFQVEPDELMFGRGLAYLGQLWMEAPRGTGTRRGVASGARSRGDIRRGRRVRRPVAR